MRCSDGVTLDALARRALARGAAYVRTMGQRDTYFVAPRGRLKLREWWREEDGGDGGRASYAYEDGEEGAVIISYARPDHSGSRFSDYRICPADNPQALLTVLAGTLVVKTVVEKRRALYRYGDTRIHLDLVTSLGAFVDLETVLAGDGKPLASMRTSKPRRQPSTGRLSRCWSLTTSRPSRVRPAT